MRLHNTDFVEYGCMTDHTDALWGITQATLDDCDPAFSSQRRAWLAIGRMHGVAISIENPSDARWRIPKLVRDGVVLRFPIPRGADFVELAMGLGEEGELSALIDAVLDGHLLALSAEGASGDPTPAAALARDELLDEKSVHNGNDGAIANPAFHQGLGFLVGAEHNHGGDGHRDSRDDFGSRGHKREWLVDSGKWLAAGVHLLPHASH